eukprot:2690669-Amphidinium_carterae.2
MLEQGDPLAIILDTYSVQHHKGKVNKTHCSLGIQMTLAKSKKEAYPCSGKETNKVDDSPTPHRQSLSMLRHLCESIFARLPGFCSHSSIIFAKSLHNHRLAMCLYAIEQR